MIYFIQADESLAVKIGHSQGDPLGRLATCQTGNHERLSLLGVIYRAGPKAERKIHLKFQAARRHSGEWFNWTPEVAAFVKARARPYDVAADRAARRKAADRLAARKGGRPPIEPGPDFWDRIEELSEAEVNAIPESVFDAQTLRTCDAIEAQNAILPVPTIYLEIAARNRERVMARIAARAAARC
jgi:hypothetical protein